MDNPMRIDPTNTGAWATLMLYSPRIYGNPVLRPLVYGFYAQADNFLLSKGDTIDEAIKRKDVINTEAVASIIRPDALGTEIDMTDFSQMWTFMLLIHLPNNVRSGILASEGSKLLVFRGHCREEPIDAAAIWMSTAIINRRCPLFVHSR